MKVKFQRSNGEIICLGSGTEQECHAIITDFLNAHNYKSYYRRCWEEDGMTKVDVGSWSEFFYLVKEDGE